MQQFNLSLWLKDKSRKVVTRDGRPVRIVCWDLKCNTPIIAAIQWNQEKEDCYCYDMIGRCANNIVEIDLFFADEEKTNKILDELKYYLENTPKEQVEKDWKEIQDWYCQHFTNEKHNEEDELTEFEKEVKRILDLCCNGIGETEVTEEWVKEESAILLDLARKELEATGWKDSMRKYKEAYEQGKQDALKDLPKWKKITKSEQNYLAYGYLSHDEYYLSIQELKDKLPKEE